MLKHCCFALLLLMLLGDKGSFKTDCVLDKGPFKNDDAIGEKGQTIYWAIFRAQDGTLQTYIHTYAYVPKILTQTSQRAEHYIHKTADEDACASGHNADICSCI